MGYLLVKHHYPDFIYHCTFPLHVILLQRECYVIDVLKVTICHLSK